MIPKSILLFFTLIYFSHYTNAQRNASDYIHNWPEWRGPEATGFAPYGNPPVEWSETKNVKWKIEIPGRGHSTPIVWGDKIFILTAIRTDQKAEMPEGEDLEGTERDATLTYELEYIHDFQVIAINRNNGSVLWRTSVIKERPIESTHELGSWASNSPATDGENLYAYFGSRGLYCLDFEGNILWDRDFGQLKIAGNYGEGNAPSVYKDKIVVIWDHQGDSFLYILDKQTGKDIFKIPRDERTSWSSPVILPVNGRDQVITNATRKMRGYDLETGELIWECSGMTPNVIPNPVVGQSIVYLMSGFRENVLKAIDLSKAKGDITGTDVIVWEYNHYTPYAPSALLAKNKLYFLRNNNGNLTCLDAADGKVNYTVEKLEGSGTVLASPVGIQDRLYVSSVNGTTYVIKQGPVFEILAENSLDDGNIASIAIAGNELFIRGFQYLYCISDE